MRKYRKYDWPTLIAEFESSGLNQTQFCQERDINPKYFNQNLAKRRSKAGSNFVSAEIKPADFETTITINVGRCAIHCPSNMPLESFASLVHSLS